MTLPLIIISLFLCYAVFLQFIKNGNKFSLQILPSCIFGISFLLALMFFFTDFANQRLILPDNSSPLNLIPDFITDQYSSVFILLFTLAGFTISLFNCYDPKENTNRSNSFLALSLSGVLGLSLSGNLLLLLIFSVFLTIVNIVKIITEGKKLFLIKLISIYLISDLSLFAGSLLLYSVTKSFAINDNISAVQNNIISGPFLAAIIILLVIAVAGKSISIPFHFWLTTKENISETTENILLSISAFLPGLIIYLKIADFIQPFSNTIFLAAGILNVIYGLFLAYNKSEARWKIKLLTITQTGLIFILFSLHEFSGGVFILLSVTLGRLALLLCEKLLRRNEDLNITHYWIYFASICAFIGLPVFIQFYSNTELLNNSIIFKNIYYAWILQCIFVLCIFSVSFLISQFLYKLNLNSFKKASDPKTKDYLDMIPVIILLIFSSVFLYLFNDFGKLVVYRPLEENGYLIAISPVINLFTVSLGFFLSYLYVQKKGINTEILNHQFFKLEDFFDNYFAGLLIDKQPALQNRTITFQGTINKLFKFNTLSAYLSLSILVIVIFYFIFRSM